MQTSETWLVPLLLVIVHQLRIYSLCGYVKLSLNFKYMHMYIWNIILIFPLIELQCF